MTALAPHRDAPIRRRDRVPWSPRAWNQVLYLTGAIPVLAAGNSNTGGFGFEGSSYGDLNAVIVGNYLTTLGRPAEADLELLEDLQMPLKALNANVYPAYKAFSDSLEALITFNKETAEHETTEPALAVASG